MLACCQCGKLCEKSQLALLPKDAETLKQWIQEYNLQLNMKKNVPNFICRSHMCTFDIPKPSDAPVSDFVSSSVEPGPMEVKDELGQVVIEEPLDLWQEAKNEPTSDFDGYPFDMEQNSFSTFDDSEGYKYADDCQPTTSSAASHEPFDANPLLYPGVSDSQILAFCVKNSTNVSGESTFKCGLCPTVFPGIDTRLIRSHLEQRHVRTMNGLMAQGFSQRAIRSCEVMDDMTKTAADKALLTFIVKNGLSYRTLQDRNLEMLAFNMNQDYEIPTIDMFFGFLQEVVDAKENSKVDKRGCPMTITFDTVTFNSVHYLAFTVSYFRTRNEVKRCLFFREMDNSKEPMSSILKTIKNAIDETEISLPIATVVTGKAEFEEPLEDMGGFKQVMVCFSQSMDKFVEALINHPVFNHTLKTLRSFIQTFPTNRSLWSRFKAFIVKRRTYGEYPELDDGHWFTTLDFITKCLHMHRLFSEFSSTNTQLKYIGVDDNVNMVYLHSLLGLCKSLVKQLAEKNATIADIIPFIGEINASIGITTSRPEVVGVVTDIFRRLLVPFVEQSDVHRFALFLHPLHNGSPLFPVVEWDNIQQGLARQLSIREAADGVPMNQLGDTKGFTSFKDAVTVEREVFEFARFVIRNRDSVSNRLESVLEWWYRNSGKFPRLYKYAKELLPIPAFSVDASYYFGEFGILSHSIQETEVSKRKLLLLASSELVDYHAKGDVVSRQICVKRKRDPAYPEDAWYAPVDIRPFREEVRQFMDTRVAHNVIQLPQGPRIPHPQYQARIQAAQAQSQQVPAPRTLKQEIEKLGCKWVPKPRAYVLADPAPYPRPAPLKRPSPTVAPTRTVVMPTSTKKYYAVRSVVQKGPPAVNGAANGSSNGTTSGTSTAPRIIRRIPVAVQPTNRGGVAPGPVTKKVYFVRSKTGPQPQPQRSS